MSLFNWFIVVIMPGGWVLAGIYKLYTMFIQKRSHDTSEINYLISNIVLNKQGMRNRRFCGKYINVSNDIARVAVKPNGELYREFYA